MILKLKVEIWKEKENYWIWLSYTPVSESPLFITLNQVMQEA